MVNVTDVEYREKQENVQILIRKHYDERLHGTLGSDEICVREKCGVTI
jgi:hypothetical protein